jgi:origin recognition complex subunit 1
MIRINFQPYTTQQLEKIVHARLRDAKEGLEEPPDVIHADGIKFAAMKVSSISGDARRALDICRYVLAFPVKVKQLSFDIDERWN